ncbi:MAG: precorrin-6A/cobalt-precorrin-6A reductase, partial [Hyphomicrobiaceae bacterium]
MTTDRTVKRVLLLGGTQESRKLAAILDSDPRFAIISSLAGRTSQPEATSRNTRRGGFGGAKGLLNYASENDIDIIVDATHPFAETISINAEHTAREL